MKLEKRDKIIVALMLISGLGLLSIAYFIYPHNDFNAVIQVRIINNYLFPWFQLIIFWLTVGLGVSCTLMSVYLYKTYNNS